MVVTSDDDDIPSDDSPSEDSPSEDSPSDDIPSEDILSEDILSDDIPFPFREFTNGMPIGGGNSMIAISASLRSSGLRAKYCERLGEAMQMVVKVKQPI